MIVAIKSMFFHSLQRPLCCSKFRELKLVRYVLWDTSGACIIKAIKVIIYGFRNKLECLSVSTRLSWKGLLITETVNYCRNYFYDTGPRFLGATAFSIMTLTITTLNVKRLFVTLSINDTHHNTAEFRNLCIVMLSVVRLNVVAPVSLPRWTIFLFKFENWSDWRRNFVKQFI
jgi:hypothetical protein